MNRFKPHPGLSPRLIEESGANKLASVAAKVNMPKVRVLPGAKVVPTVNTTMKIQIAFTRVPFVGLGNNLLTEINVKTAQLARFNHYQ